MVLGGQGRYWVVTLDSLAILTSVQTDWVVLGGMAHWWVVLLDSRTIIASV